MKRARCQLPTNDPAPYSDRRITATPLPDRWTCRHKSFHNKLAKNAIINSSPDGHFCHSSQHFQVIFMFSNTFMKMFNSSNCCVFSGVFTTLASFNPFISLDEKLDERKSRTEGSQLKPSGSQKRKFGRWMKKKPHRKTIFPYHTEPSKVRMDKKNAWERSFE